MQKPTNRSNKVPRRNSRKNRGKSNPSSVSKTQVRQMIKSVIRSTDEVKYIDMATLTTTAISTTMTTAHLTGISQGASVNNRIGNEIRAVGVEIFLTFITADTSNLGRVLVVRDRQPNKAAFGQTDLFVNATDAQSWFNEDYRDRFEVIYDKICDVGTPGPESFTFREYVPLKGTVYYTGSSNSIANVMSNAFFMVYLSDSGAVTHPTLTGNVRFWFRETENTPNL